jgi:hypothetical protein
MIDAQDIFAATKAVTAKWTKQRKAEERGSTRPRIYCYGDRVNFTDVAAQILPGAYQHASGDGRYSVSKRQLYYACRDAFKERTDRELEYGYFANTLLVQYMNRHPAETAAWKLTADPRGTLIVPNTGHELKVPVGTVQIDNYLDDARRRIDAYDITAGMDVEWPSRAGGQRYQAVLYIEKEGFAPILEEAQIAERFDLAILSCKGQSVVAARKLVDCVCAVGGGVTLFVVHDFDKAGFEIAQRLTAVSDWADEYDRVTYRFENEIAVTDLGLRLADVEEYDLDEEGCDFSGGFASDSICTQEEKDFLREGRRVELNAFTSPQFVEWLEGKLTEHLGGKRLIPPDHILADAYRRALIVARVNRAIAAVGAKAEAEAATAAIPEALRADLTARLNTSGPAAWDQVLYDLARRRRRS